MRPNQSANDVQSVKVLKSVNIQLRDRNLRKIVISILKSCDLPTTYVDNVSPKSEVRKKYFSEKDVFSFYKNLSQYRKEFFVNDLAYSEFVGRVKKKSQELSHLK